MRAADPERAVRDFGRRVAEERAKHGWTQADFAEAAGLSLRWIQFVESGEQNVTIKSAVEIANVLGVPVTTLFDLPKTKKPAPGRPRRSATAPSPKRRRRS